MSEYVIVKVWHGGKLVLKPEARYDGGVTDMFQVDFDKMSYFELMDYVIEFGSYKNKEFKMWYLQPGKKFDVGLVELKDDKDVNDMMEVLGDDIKHILNLYCDGNSFGCGSKNKKGKKKLAELGAHLKAHSSPSNPIEPNYENPKVKVLKPTASPASSHRRITRASARNLELNIHTNDLDFEAESGQSNDGGEDFEIVLDSEYYKFDEVVTGAASDTDDEEWRESVNAIVVANKEQQDQRNDALLKSIADQGTTEPTETEPNNEDNQEEYSSAYEDSDGDVNSPGESEDDDILGKKYCANVPVVDENTDWSKWVWVVGTRFPTRESFKEAVREYAVANGRDLKVTVSDKGRQGRVGLSCKENCPFRVYTSYNHKKVCYMVKSVVNTHTCQRSMEKNTQLTCQFVASHFLHVFKLKPHWPAKEIQDAVKEKFKVIVTKWFAYKAKRCAHNMLHGSMRDHYSRLGSYLQALREANPSSTFELLTVPPQYYGMENTNVEVFFRLFVCFGSIKRGFLEGCRKVLCLDGCFLKTFIGGMLLCAIGRDANNQMYPVAYAVIEGENTLSWTWFMSELKKALEVVDDGSGWTLISDQQKGLLNAVVSHWGNAEHRNCARHIYANWHKKHKGDELKGLFWRAARSYSQADYQLAIDEMKELDKDATEAFLKQNPKVFCRCFLQTDTKCDVIVNNMAETFNGYIIKSRSKHIINMLEDIRVQLMTRLINKQRQMTAKDVVICPRVQEKIENEKNKAYRCEVYPSSATKFQVRAFDDVSVDIVERTCTCRRWDLSGIPCYHVCALAGFLHLPAEDFCAPCYKKDSYMKSYAYTIPPLPSDKYWPIVTMPLDAPPIKIGPGRPKKNRKKDPHESTKKPGKLTRHGKKSSCSNCGSTQHNKRKCKEKPKNEPKAKRPRGRPRKDRVNQDGAQSSQMNSQVSFQDQV